MNVGTHYSLNSHPLGIKSATNQAIPNEACYLGSSDGPELAPVCLANLPSPEVLVDNSHSPDTLLFILHVG